MNKERVYVTNMPTGIPGMLAIFLFICILMSSCTDYCKNTTTFQCMGKIAKETVTEFNKGYSPVEAKP